MGNITEADVVAAVGSVDEFIVREALRTNVSVFELDRAIAFANGPANADADTYCALPDRMQRLGDLLCVALDCRLPASFYYRRR